MMDLRARARRALKYLSIAAVVLVLVGVFGGSIVMISGIVPIKASSGHWAVTRALLDFAKRRSVATHTMRTTAPPLDSERQLLIGAGQYAIACEPCHGSPAVKQPRIAAHMTPQPPDLAKVVPTYGSQHLFYIVKHGIKLTGMPAWPAHQRDDEVWAMVSFLRQLPGMDATRYEMLTGRAHTADGRPPIEEMLGPPQNVREAIADNCARCHGFDGLGRGAGAFPLIAGQRVEYLTASLRAYARGERHSGIMGPLAATLGEDEMQGIAAYYAGRAPGPRAAAVNAQQVELGRRIAFEGLPDQLVPACRECHGPGVQRNATYPRLAGQYSEYLRLQLTLFKDKRRGGTPFHLIMQDVAAQLHADQIEAVTAFYSSLPPER